MTETVQHVVSLWLTDPSDRERLQEMSATAHKLIRIPGVLDVKFGPSIGPTGGDEIDAAMMVSFENVDVISVYLPHPLHLDMLNLTKRSVRRIQAFYINA